MADGAELKPKDAPDLSRFDWEDALRLEDQLSGDVRRSCRRDLA
jgi:glutaryl-CoA dehydrogenase